jgi:hypothetical protein
MLGSYSRGIDVIIIIIIIVTIEIFALRILIIRVVLMLQINSVHVFSIFVLRKFPPRLHIGAGSTRACCWLWFHLTTNKQPVRIRRQRKRQPLIVVLESTMVRVPG